jgi:glycosyltransferase involved in cell wall biosynthesis
VRDAEGSQAGITGRPHDDGVPLVTVVVPTWQGENTIGRALESALAQTHARLEVIVAIDGSTDGTRDVVAAYAHTDPRIRVIDHERSSGGPARPRNSAISASSGDWVAFLDDDDWWLPDKLEAQLARAGQTGAGVVYSRATVVDESGEGDFHERWSVHLPSLPEGDVLEPLLRNCFLPLSTVLVRRQWLEVVGGFDESLVGWEDYHMWLRLALSGGTFAAVDRPLGYYAWQTASRSHRDPDRRLESLVNFWEGLMATFPLEARSMAPAARRARARLAQRLLVDAFRHSHPPALRVRLCARAMGLSPTYGSLRVAGSLALERLAARA